MDCVKNGDNVNDNFTVLKYIQVQYQAFTHWHSECYQTGMTKTYKMLKKRETNEWIVREYVNGVLQKNADYFTDSKQDALDTMRYLESEAVLNFNKED